MIHLTIIMDDVPLAVVSEQRNSYLGLIFDEHLSWSHHVVRVCKSMSYYLHLLFKEDLLKTLTESLVLCRLTYSLPVCMGSFTIWLAS